MLLHTADASGFAEYVDPYTGEGRGALGFSWTAALTLDLLHGPSTHPSPRKGPDPVNATEHRLLVYEGTFAVLSPSATPARPKGACPGRGPKGP